MTRDELLTALAVERQDNTWWRHRPAIAAPQTWTDDQFVDDDVTCARRRRELEQDWREERREATG